MVAGWVGCGPSLFCSMCCGVRGVPPSNAPMPNQGIEDRRKALLNARTSVAPYQGLDVADQEKQDGELMPRLLR